MAIVLYKAGNTYTSPKGIRCQFQLCDPFSFLHLLEDGWFYTPEECYAEKEDKTAKAEKEAAAKAEPEAEEEATESVLVDPTPEDEIRATAKAAGITGWWNKNIEKLKSELTGLNDAE